MCSNCRRHCWGRLRCGQAPHYPFYFTRRCEIVDLSRSHAAGGGSIWKAHTPAANLYNDRLPSFLSSQQPTDKLCFLLAFFSAQHRPNVKTNSLQSK
eukprot:748076-Hanusia_phi.AAC.1